MGSNTTYYLLVKCYMDGRRDGGISCDEEEAIQYIKELMGKLTTEVTSGEAAQECRICTYSSIAPGSSHHIKCSNQDPFMKGDQHGIKNGWFIYPYNFDPIWKTSKCINYYGKE